jgi:small subunit ribosomal protein S6
MSESMINYEVTFIVDPVLSSDEIKATAQTYVDQLKEAGCNIVHVDEMGLRQLTYPINNRTSGIFYCIEFGTETGQVIALVELAMRRDSRILRFLTVRLDKYGVKYNEDKRNGLIGKVKKKSKDKKDSRSSRRSNRNEQQSRPAKKEEPAAAKTATATATAAEANCSEAPAPKAEAKPTPEKVEEAPAPKAEAKPTPEKVEEAPAPKAEAKPAPEKAEKTVASSEEE